MYIPLELLRNSGNDNARVIAVYFKIVTIVLCQSNLLSILRLITKEMKEPRNNKRPQRGLLL